MTSAVRMRALGHVELEATPGDAGAVLAHRKCLALLAYLAFAGPRAPHGRESLAALLWPEAPADSARHSLRESLRILRRALGANVIVAQAGDEMSLDPALVSTDVADFERAIDQGRHADAMALYRGALLDGFSVSGVSSEFEHWLDGERARLKALAVRAAAAITDDAEQAGNLPMAVHAARDQVRLAPFDEPSFRRLMALLDRAGDGAGALYAYDAFSESLMRQLETPPSPDTRAIAARIRATRADAPLPVPPWPNVVRTALATELTATTLTEEPPAPATPAPPAPTVARIATSARRLRTRVATALVLVSAVVTATALARNGFGRHADAPRELLAVGAIRVHSRDTLLSPGLVRQLIATDLARIDGLDVVSGERIAELLAPLDGKADTAASLAVAARRAGATQVLEGIVSGGAGGALRIDVQRVDLTRGTIRGAHTLEAGDIFSLTDRLSRDIADAMGRQFPHTPLAELTSTSLVARRLYDEGVRSYYEGDAAGALRLFEDALREDSTFTMAAFYGALAGQRSRGDTTALRILTPALRQSRRGPERERLLIATAWANIANSPSLVPLAESLATRFPLEADGDYWLGSGLAWAGDRAHAIPYLRHAIERDSASLTATQRTSGGSIRCRACDAFGSLAFVYEQSDSLGAAERLAREWIRRQPAGHGWIALAEVYEQAGRTADARATFGEASRRLGHDLTDAIVRARLALRDGDFVTSDRLLDDEVTSGDPNVRRGAEWWLAISLRQQGRVREALQVTERRAQEEVAAFGGEGFASTHMARAQALFEMGQFAAAAGLFDSLAYAPSPFEAAGAEAAPALAARQRTWMLTHAATASAAAGDTGKLGGLADSVERLGALEGYGRDRQLHFYIRGLLFKARGDNSGAAMAFEHAMYSPNAGYTRVNLELARAFVALGRPREAVATLQSALRGPLESSNFYVTRTELRDALARAFAAAGQSDSARAEYAVVARAWNKADAPFRARVRTALASQDPVATSGSVPSRQ